jgi:hypothetical protein
VSDLQAESHSSLPIGISSPRFVFPIYLLRKGLILSFFTSQKPYAPRCERHKRQSYMMCRSKNNL